MANQNHTIFCPDCGHGLAVRGVVPVEQGNNVCMVTTFCTGECSIGKNVSAVVKDVVQLPMAGENTTEMRENLTFFMGRYLSVLIMQERKLPDLINSVR